MENESATNERQLSLSRFQQSQDRYRIAREARRSDRRSGVEFTEDKVLRHACEMRRSPRSFAQQRKRNRETANDAGAKQRSGRFNDAGTFARRPASDLPARSECGARTSGWIELSQLDLTRYGERVPTLL